MAKANSALQELCHKLELSNGILRQFMKVSAKERKNALMTTNSSDSDLYMYSSTFLQDLPNGEENGKFLTLEIEGIPIRVVLIHLKKKSFDLRAKQSMLPPEIMKGEGDQFFGYLAEKVYSFAYENKVHDGGLPLGVTISFPTVNKSISSGSVVRWTKGFSCTGVVHENFLEKLQEAISDYKDFHTEVCAFINDSTAVLLATAWKAQRCKIAVIVASGTNMAYVESVKNVANSKCDTRKPFVIINTEYGHLGSNGSIDFIRTGWDRDLDSATLQPGINPLEKMISSLYLAEFIRRVLVTAAQRRIVFRGSVSERLLTVGAFEPNFIIDIAEDLTSQRAARMVLNKLGYPMSWAQDCSDLQYVCQVAWTRAGHLVAASVAGLLNYIRYRRVTIGVDGSFYRSHPSFPDIVQDKVRELTDPQIQFEFVLADDGGGLGGALAAFCSLRERQSKPEATKNQQDTFFSRFEKEHKEERAKARKSSTGNDSLEDSAELKKSSQEPVGSARRKSGTKMSVAGNEESEPRRRTSSISSNNPVSGRRLSAVETKLWNAGPRKSTIYVRSSSIESSETVTAPVKKGGTQSKISKLTRSLSQKSGSSNRLSSDDTASEYASDKPKKSELTGTKKPNNVLKKIQSEINKKEMNNKNEETKKLYTDDDRKRENLSNKKADIHTDNVPVGRKDRNASTALQKKRGTASVLGKGNKSEGVAESLDAIHTGIEDSSGELKQGRASQRTTTSQTRGRNSRGGGQIRGGVTGGRKPSNPHFKELYMSVSVASNTPFEPGESSTMELKHESDSWRETRSLEKSTLSSESSRAGESDRSSRFSKNQVSDVGANNVVKIGESDEETKMKISNKIRNNSGRGGSRPTSGTEISQARKVDTNLNNTEPQQLETTNQGQTSSVVLAKKKVGQRQNKNKDPKFLE